MSSIPENSNKVAFSSHSESIAGNGKKKRINTTKQSFFIYLFEERRSGRNKKLSPWYVEHVKEEMKKVLNSFFACFIKYFF